MLELRNIVKSYITGELRQDALKNVSIAFRESEFVSILGHSGSGKTTMLNIIGGLDQYTSGDLIINGVSTKKYKDRDWDAYRNHDIGFVFQSYNLIPHQTILANVELALTLSGVSKAERQRRATEALTQVGLKDHIHKRPNQLSGGQMQRVAIARALVNNPHIILADEPTGALDSETSVQVMNILKEVSKDRLVIMVTHNPELAYEYSSRIVKLSDGVITDDSDPYNETQELIEKPARVKLRSMSFFTALSLSLNNLMTKKLRTFMTSFAGSIGIMGIALILSVSAGFQDYIDSIEENTLSSYPLSIYNETADATSALLSMISENQKSDSVDDKVVEKRYVTKMFTSVGTNDLRSLKAYLGEHKSEINQISSLITYKYDVSPLIYTKDAVDALMRVNPSSMSSMMAYSGGNPMASLSGGGGRIFSEMLDDFDLLDESYDVLAGRWPEKYNEMIVVLSEPNGISDMLTYALGMKDSAAFMKVLQQASAGEEVEEEGEALELSYDDFLNLKYKLVDRSKLYKYNEKYDIYEAMTDDADYMNKVFEEAEDLHIVGVVCVKKDSDSTALSTGVGYLKELTQHVIALASVSDIVLKQQANTEIDVFSNKTFKQQEEEERKGLDFNEMISVDTYMLNNAFSINPDAVNIDEQKIRQLSEKYMKKISVGALTDTKEARDDLDILLSYMCQETLNSFIDSEKNEEGTALLNKEHIDAFLEGFFETDAFKAPIKAIDDKYYNNSDVVANHFKNLMPKFLNFAVEALGFDEAVSVDTLKSNTESITATYIDIIMNPDTDSEDYNMREDEFLIFDGLARTLTFAQIGHTVNGNSQSVSQEFARDIAALFGPDLIRVDGNMIANAFKFNMTEEDLVRLMNTMNASTERKTAESNLLRLGYQDPEAPSTINFYFKDFASKQDFKDFMAEYNKNVDEEKKISYTDVTGLLMGSVETIIDAVTYVLIAFVSISLVVSTIMIGVITLISVMERTKEIGVLRAIGASKRDVGNVFNAETFIVGLLSGLIGIGGSLLLLIPINSILHKLTNIATLSAVLPKESCAVLVLISVVLTLISGLIPSKSASKKNPVEALRTE